MKTRKVVIIGAGHVGSHVASALALRGLADEIVFIDLIADHAFTQGEDNYDATPYCPHPVTIRTGDYADMADADMVVMSASGKIANQDRLLEAGVSADIVRSIAPKIRDSGYKGVIVSITNPCDVIAWGLHDLTGLAVIGTGTALDSARLKAELARQLSVAPQSVNAYVYGEHGNSQFVPFSIATVGAMPLRTFVHDRGIKLDEKEIETRVMKKGWAILNGIHTQEGKGCTEFGIGNAASEIINAIFHDSRLVLPCSTNLKGLYTDDDVYASVPAIIGRDGVMDVLRFTLSEEEQARLNASCSVIKTTHDRYFG